MDVSLLRRHFTTATVRFGPIGDADHPFITVYVASQANRRVLTRSCPPPMTGIGNLDYKAFRVD
jgi:hypothetical protein